MRGAQPVRSDAKHIFTLNHPLNPQTRYTMDTPFVPLATTARRRETVVDAFEKPGTLDVICTASSGTDYVQQNRVDASMDKWCPFRWLHPTALPVPRSDSIQRNPDFPATVLRPGHR